MVLLLRVNNVGIGYLTSNEGETAHVAPSAVLANRTDEPPFKRGKRMLSDNAACKRAIRRGYKARRNHGLITLWDRSGKEVLRDATPEAVDTWLRDENQQATGETAQ